MGSARARGAERLGLVPKLSRLFPTPPAARSRNASSMREDGAETSEAPTSSTADQPAEAPPASNEAGGEAADQPAGAKKPSKAEIARQAAQNVASVDLSHVTSPDDWKYKLALVGTFLDV